MANTATLASLRARALDYADMASSSFPVEDRVRDYINAGLGELHDLLINAFEDYARELSTISLMNGTEAYSLPSDFYKALKVFALHGGHRYRLRRFSLDELDQLQDDENFVSYTPDDVNLRYRIMGDQIFFTPVPSGGSVELWYAPQLTELADEGDTVSVMVPVSWEDFVALHAAIRLKIKEESDPSALMTERERIRQNIVAFSATRDAAEPQTVADVTRWGATRLRRVY